MNNPSQHIIQALSDERYLSEMPEDLLWQEVLEAPWFIAPYFLLARKEQLENPEQEPKQLTKAAVRAMNRGRLKAWMGGQLDSQLESLAGSLSQTVSDIPTETFVDAPFDAQVDSSVVTSSETFSVTPLESPTDTPVEEAIPDPAEFTETSVEESIPDPAEPVAADLTPVAETAVHVEATSEIQPSLPEEPGAVLPMVEEPATLRSFTSWLAAYQMKASEQDDTQVSDSNVHDSMPDQQVDSDGGFHTGLGTRLSNPEPSALSELNLPLDSSQVLAPPMDSMENLDDMSSLIEQQRKLRLQRLSGAQHQSEKKSGEQTEKQAVFDPIVASSELSDANLNSPQRGPQLPAGAWRYPQTETYAGILVQQGKWTEAEAIYEALSLRHPEKSGFFALRIREIQEKRL